MKVKTEAQKTKFGHFKVQGSALEVRNQLVVNPKKKLANQNQTPRPHCGCC